jgi:hypothetical protein
MKRYRIVHRAGKASRLENDPAGQVLLFTVALEGVQCVRIFPGMKPRGQLEYTYIVSTQHTVTS